MRFIFYTAAIAALVGLSISKEIEQDKVKAAQLYDTGVIHNRLMSAKHRTFDRQKHKGAYNSSQYPELGFARCKDGFAEAFRGDANNTFKCSNTNLHHFLSHEALGSNGGEGSSSWGWTDPKSGREFVAIGQSDGAAFVEITKRGKMVYLGRLPQYPTAPPIIWREIRAYKNYMIIGSEALNHGVQIFDMTKLLDISPRRPVTFNNEIGDGLTGWFNGLPIGRTHNVVVNEATNWAYAVGAAPRNDTRCRAGLIFIDLSDPTKPVSPGCDPQDGYVHDAQCVVYKGPDTRYSGKEICYGYNEDTLTIYDVSSKPNSTVISRTSYQGAAYTHQGWLLDTEWQEFLLMDDEYDEYDGIEPAADGYPVTYIWDIRDLAAPKQTGIYKSKHYGIDHNQYVRKDPMGSGTLRAYQSNYGMGFHVLDVTSISSDPTGAGVQEIAYFDVYPEDDMLPNGGIKDFVGTWSSYALFNSGWIFVNTIERGAFVLRLTV